MIVKIQVPQKTEDSSEVNKLEVGVIVGDFQIHYLNNAYQQYFDYCDKKSKVFIVLINDRGISLEHPLSFESRVAMIREEYPNCVTYKVKKGEDHKAWCDELDNAVSLLTEHNVTLYLTPENHDYNGELDVRKIQLNVEAHKEMTIDSSIKGIPDTQEARFGALWLARNISK